MKPTIEILISSPLSGSEASALRDLAVSLKAPALIFANFEVSSGSSSQQIDFVVITESRAELIELKQITAPVRGGINGLWEIETSPGLFVPYSGPNPWEQAKTAKLVLSDAMRKYAKGHPEVPKPAKPRYFEQFDASVSVYPILVPGSQVFQGNFKAWVRSFPDTVECLNSCHLESTWAIKHWRNFAIDYLRLQPASLAEAINATVFQAHQAVDEYALRLRHTSIAPLLTNDDRELVGQKVIDALRSSTSMLLLGRSGLGKSFHLDHYRRVCFEFDEIPVLLQARYYHRDLKRAIHKSIGPYTRQSPAELLNAAKQLGKRPVLIVDGLNECSEDLQVDLGNDLSAFQLNYDARLVAASQTVPTHEFFGSLRKIELDPLRDCHKQAIFSFHTGKQDNGIPTLWYEQLATAYDLALAGRCQYEGTVAESRCELYKAYIRSVVPSLSARTVLRRLACYMGEHFKPALSFSDFEHIAEMHIKELGLNLSIADELLKSPILAVDREAVAFEHDLLKDYFRSEHFLREVDPAHLSTRLDEPRYAGLIEFVLPALTDELLIQEILLKSGVEILRAAFRGSLGKAAQTIVRTLCQMLLVVCRDSLHDLTVKAWIGERNDNQPFVSGARLENNAYASDTAQKLLSVIAVNLDDTLLQDAFLELLSVGEWALKEAAEHTGREHGVKAKAVLRELVRGELICSNSSGPVHPFIFLFREVRDKQALGARQLGVSPIREPLLRMVGEGSAGMLALLILLRDLCICDSIDCADVLNVARQAWRTDIFNIQMETLHFIRCNARAIRDLGGDAEAAAIEMLDTFEVQENLVLSSLWFECRSSFSGFDTGIDVESALGEFRQILQAADKKDDPVFQLDKECEPNLTYQESLGNRASSALGKIFEHVFQGVYYDAYLSLSQDEMRKLLILALENSAMGFLTDWYLSELCKVGCEGAENVLVKFGSRIDPKSFCPQDTISCYLMAHEAWAQLASEPIPYSDDFSEDHRVWAIVGELIFWLNWKIEEAPGRISILCSELADHPNGVPDVFQQIEASNKLQPRMPALKSLFANFKDAIRQALHQSLQCEGSLTSLFWNSPTRSVELFRWTISTLGEIGNCESIQLLQPWTEDRVYGSDAIRAIERIQLRNISSRGREDAIVM